MIELTDSHIRRIEEQLNEMGYNNVEFSTLDEHPASDNVMIWFKQDKPGAGFQYELCRLDFSSNRPPYVEII